MTTADFDSSETLVTGGTFTEIDSGIVWRVEREEDAPEPFLSKLVCTQ